MQKVTLAVVISSLLAGAAIAGQVDPMTNPPASQQAQSTSQTDTSRPGTTSTAPDADTATGTSSVGNGGSETVNPDVGTPRSNVDEQSSSGSYYPYSAGTAGDDPAYPKSTAVDPGDLAKNKTSEPMDNWAEADYDGDGYLSQDELAKVAPTLSANFTEMDVDGDQKLNQDELRNWHESHKARMDADQGANTSSAAPSSGAPTMDATGTPSDTLGTPDSTPPGHSGD
jgi:hypothetical protein